MQCINSLYIYLYLATNYQCQSEQAELVGLVELLTKQTEPSVDPKHQHARV